MLTSIHLSSLVDIVAFTDPASGKRGEQLKRARARQACVAVGQDAIGRIFTLHAWADRIETDKFIDMLLDINRQWRPQRFGIEANAMQIIFGDAVQIIADLKGEHVPFEPIYQPTNVTKEWRNRTRLQPSTANGSIFLQEHHHELRAELLGHPNFPTVDLVDCLATCVEMLPDRSQQRQQQDTELQQLAAYLRETGAKPDYIRQRLDEVRQQKEQQILDRLTLHHERPLA